MAFRRPFGRRVRTGLFGAAAAVALSAPATAQLVYDTHSIDLGRPDEIRSLMHVDYTGSDVDDIAVLGRYGDTVRLDVYSFDGAAWRPVHRGDLTEAFVGRETMDSSGAGPWMLSMKLGGRDRLLIGSRCDGVDYLEPETWTPTPWLQSPPANGAGGSPDDWRSVLPRDFNDDGLDDLLLRCQNSFTIWTQASDGGVSEPSLHVLPSDYLYFGSGDYDDDGLTDLVFMDLGSPAQRPGERIAVHLGVAGGRFAPEPIHVGTPTEPEGGNRRRFSGVGDFNGDGILDLHSYSDAETRYGVRNGLHFGRRDGNDVSFRDEPDTSVSGEVMMPVSTHWRSTVGGLLDLDGDKKHDLAVPVLRAGWVGEWVTRRLRVDVHAYRLRDTGYPAAPDFQTRTRVRIRFKELNSEVLAENTVTLLGDLNGDGILDLVVPGGKIKAHLGTGKGDLFEERASRIRPALAYEGFLQLSDVNRDGKDDLILYQEPDDEGGRIAIALSR